MIGNRAESVLNRAVRYAVERNHEYFTLEHVLWSLLLEPEVTEVVQACGGTPRSLKLELESHMDSEMPKAARREKRLESSEELNSEKEQTPIATLGIQRLIQRALFHVQSAGKDEIKPVDLLVALFQAKESQALHLLQKQGVERLDVLSYLSHGIRKSDAHEDSGDEESGSPGLLEEIQNQMEEDAHDAHEGAQGEDGQGPARGRRTSKKGAQKGQKADDPLTLYALNLNDRARAGKIDPLVGRQGEIDRMVQTLCRRRKNNPLLVGEAGVGKTALAEGLALRVIEKKVPDLLAAAEIYALDLGSVLAGAKFRGDFEQRLKGVLSALERRRSKGVLPILVIDEIHTIVGAGAVSGGAMDAANLLKPSLSQGELRCIGSTTYAEYRNVFEKDHALARRFQKIDVPEPTQPEAIQILEGLKPRFEEHHGVKYTGDAVRLAVELSAKHLTERFLPDKAIDVLDEAGARARLRKGPVAAAARPVAQGAAQGGAQGGVLTPDQLPEAARETHEPAAEGSADGAAVAFKDGVAVIGGAAVTVIDGAAGQTIIDGAAIEEIIAQIARIPARSVSTSQRDRLRNLERDLKLTIFGQDQAIEALVTSIRLARSGLRTGDRPVGSFLFCGPTGVGKTELSKQLAHCLGVPFLRFDMSEYSEKHTLSRLIGAPPGYVGFEQAGLLTDALLKNPHSVLLLDEIEKAHGDIWNILLQIMDHGTLTDNNGRKADFRNAVILMTSNVGSRDLDRRPLGMGHSDAAPDTGTQPPAQSNSKPAGKNETQSAAQKAVETTFSPEFRNRLDAIVYFNPLGPVTVGQVVGKQLLELESQLLAKGVESEVTPEAREWLAARGYDRRMGARPMARLIQDRIKKALAEEILFGKLEGGGSVRVTVRDGELAFEIQAKEPAAAPVAEETPRG